MRASASMDVFFSSLVHLFVGLCFSPSGDGQYNIVRGDDGLPIEVYDTDDDVTTTSGGGGRGRLWFRDKTE